MRKANATVNSVLETPSCSCLLTAPTRYRCDVIAGGALDLVTGMGGRLVDLAMAGWEVSAALADGSDARPLRILGIAAVDLDCLLTDAERLRIPQVLAVAGDVWAKDERVRREVRSAAEELRTEVAVWGGSGAIELGAALDQPLSPTRHRISAAGRAFKASALAAVGCPPVFEPAECYWTTGPAPRYIHTCI
ncbi:hypothetical protein H7I93_13975 [Mycobacterium nebraskense]|uniref:hypothetical protein n=1 Tax=Mycobacterium nebraskense TaxID=244292 RepID=UPI0012E2C760|nr:hypothetical protein [Mycobacterium nebraskense]MCV7118285.1 hypothetical protein [Mycobacterium nebraskense]